MIKLREHLSDIMNYLTKRTLHYTEDGQLPKKYQMDYKTNTPSQLISVTVSTWGEAKTADKIHMAIIGFNQERWMIGHRTAFKRSNPIKTSSFN